MGSLQEQGQKALSKAPQPLQRALGGIGVQFRDETGPTQSIASGSQSGNMAGVLAQDPRTINVMDREAFNRAPEQLATHEGVHLWQNNLPPSIQAAIPEDNHADPYNFGGTEGVRSLLKQGKGLANMPREQAAAAMQYGQSQGMPEPYNQLAHTMDAVPLSQIDMTDPKAKLINTHPRTPQVPPSSVPGMNYAAETYQKGQPAPGDMPPVPAGFEPAGNSATPPVPAGFEPAGNTPKPAPTGTLSAAPAPSWGTQLRNDLEQGGNRTVVGRVLGHLQGNGDKGYSGLESGVSPGAAQYLGSPEIGAAKIVQGAQEVPQHPGKGLLHVAGGALQAATLPSAFLGGPAANAAADALPELTPTRQGAGKLFREVMQHAENQPVNFTRSMAPLERTQQLASRGAPGVKAADQLYQRVNTINPVNYGEARDFASNLSGLSASEKMALNPQMHRSVGQLSHALNADIGDAAAAAGQGENYSRAMTEYARAAHNADTAKRVAKIAVPAAAGAVGLSQYQKLKGLLGY